MISLLAVTTVTSAPFPALSFATDMAQDTKAQLIIVIACGKIADQAQTTLSRFRREKLLMGKIEEAGINLPSEYVLEFSYQPFVDTLHSSLRRFHPDFLISAVSQDITSAQDIASNTRGNLILIPNNAVYRPIRTIALVYDAVNLPQFYSVRPLIKLAQACGASVQVVEFDHIRPLVVPEVYQANLDLDRLLGDVPHRFSFYQRESMVQGITDYLYHHTVHLLALLISQPYPNNTHPHYT